MAKKSTSPAGVKILARNKKAFFDYHIEDRFEAGVALLGSEVKSIRAGKISLVEAFAKFTPEGNLHLCNCHVAEYPWANRNNHEPLRPRQLLLSRRELGKLSQAITLAGATVIPLAVYLKEGRIKVEIGVAKGKKLYDKRESLKLKTSQRELERDLH